MFRTIFRNFCVFLFAVFQIFSVSAQNSDEAVVFDSDSIFDERYGTPVHLENDGKKNYPVAILGAVFPQVLIYSWSRWGIEAGWAQTSPDLFFPLGKRVPEFDTDWVWTNFVLHPFQGGLYYLSGRNANLNRIESMLIAAFGDFTWEWFYETTDPSISDLIYSFVGAFATGEIMYRLSLEAERKKSILGYFVNPMRIWSEPWTKRKPRGTVGNIRDFWVCISAGTAHSYTDSAYSSAQSMAEHFPFQLGAEFFVVYNDPYGHDSNVPYSQFEIDFGAASGPSSGFARGMSKIEEYIMYDVFFKSSGMLFSRSPDFGENKTATIGICLDYNVRWHSFFDIAALSPGVCAKIRHSFEKSRIEWQIHLDWNIFGITDNYYIHRDPAKNLSSKERDYDYVTGSELVFIWKYITDSGFLFENNVHFYAMYDFAAQKHDNLGTGFEFCTFWDSRAEIPVSKKVHLGIKNELYIKKAFYDPEEDVFQILNSTGVYAKFDLM